MMEVMETSEELDDAKTQEQAWFLIVGSGVWGASCSCCFLHAIAAKSCNNSCSCHLTVSLE